jgi:sigma-B regulation protein RsbU (phosphoserine phosphatase)
VTLGSAGHFFPYLVTPQRGASRELTVDRGLPLGVEVPAEYASATVELGAGPCTLFAYTDGVVEAMNADEELFGLPRTLDALHALPDLDPQQMIGRVRSAITSFCGPVPQSDDITMLAVYVP